MSETGFKYDVFISYSHKDEEWVWNTLLPTLEQQGLKVCIDDRDFVAGKPAIINMQDASEASRHTLLVLTPKWVESEWTLYESVLARTDDPSGLKRRTIPLLLESCKPPKFISILSWVNFTDKNRESEAWQNLIRSIQETGDPEDGEGSEQKQLIKSVTKYREDIHSQISLAMSDLDSKSPYRALLEYDLRDVAFFFGRETAKTELLNAINRSPLTVLHAESGAGKTSLLKAAIRPYLLAKGHLPIYVRPRQDPVDMSIKWALLQQAHQLRAWKDTTLPDFTQEVSRLLNGKWLVIILDQFEEFFTLQSQETRASFIKQLAQCLDNDLLHVRWVLSLRGEWLSKLATFRPYIRNPIENNVLLERLKRDEARLAICKPAELKGLNYESQLVDTILDELGPDEIHPPDLQIVCSALYEARRTNETISKDLHESLGGTKGILQEHLTRVLKRLPDEQRYLAKQLLILLVDDDGARLSLSRDDLNNRLKKQGTDTINLDDTLAQLVDSHLLRLEESNIDDRTVFTYELAHDELASKIELEPTVQRRKIAQKLIEQKIPHYKRDGLLLSPDELSSIVPHENYLDLNKDALELLKKSKRSAQTTQLRSGAGSFAMTLVMIAVSLFLTRLLSITIGHAQLFWIGIIVFAVVGARRGWRKELLVAFSLVLALALNVVLRRYLPAMQSLPESDTLLFWGRMIILLTLVYFGYQTVASIPYLASRSEHERLQDTLFGGILGALNGYLIVGTILFYTHIADYPFEQIIPKPVNSELFEFVNRMMVYMPPRLLGEPGIYFAMILAYVFILVVFIDVKSLRPEIDSLKRMVSKAHVESSTD